MMITNATLRSVKITFALADAMRNPQSWDANKFAQELLAKRSEFELMTDAQLDSKLGWLKRKQLYEDHRWTLETVNLSDCYVEWSGGCDSRGNWAKGAIPKISAEIRLRNDANDRVWTMKQKVDLFSPGLPIICTKINNGWSIDDGCNRAIAAFLIGKQTIAAYLGRK